MFCHKCGQESPEGSAFCQKCGEKLITDERATVTMGEPNPITVEEQWSPVVNDTPSVTKEKSSARARISVAGRVLSVISLILLLPLFSGLGLSPALLVGGVGLGILLAGVNMKRPLKVNKIIELVVGAVLLIVAFAVGGASGGQGALQLVKNGTLDAYPNITVGEAFDNFLTDPTWEVGEGEDGETYVTVRGSAPFFMDGDVEHAVQFIVNEEEERFNYYALELDGLPQNDLIALGVIDDIFNTGLMTTGVRTDDTAVVSDDEITSVDGMDAVQVAKKYYVKTKEDQNNVLS